MNKFRISGIVKRFPGKGGWHYVELDETLSSKFRPLVAERWPALLNASFKINSTEWKSSIMPIKDGPLFIALPAKVRSSEAIEIGQVVEVEFELNL